MHLFIITQSSILICHIAIMILLKQLTKAPTDYVVQTNTFLLASIVLQVISFILRFNAKEQTTTSRVVQFVSILFLMLAISKMSSIVSWIKINDTMKQDTMKQNTISALFVVIIGAMMYDEYLTQSQKM